MSEVEVGVEGAPLSERAECCRACGAALPKPFLDLGETPLADRLIAPERASAPELRFPLEVAICERCALVQITETVAPEILFADCYPYYSSFSPALLAHAKALAEKTAIARDLVAKPGAFVVEIASNDGYLLKNYAALGVDCLGVDPADGPAAAARAVGVETWNTFFSAELAERVVAERGRADVIHANNVLAHVADLCGMVEGLATLLKDDGVAVIEAPYVKHLIERVEFDTIYHEHLCYFSVTALSRLFAAHGLSLNEIEHLDIHGGSLRLYVEPRRRVGASVQEALAQEAAEGLDGARYYEGFAARVAALQSALKAELAALKAEGLKIAAYGAAAKGATLLNASGIGAETLDFVVDRNVHKQGKLMPGARLPIKAPETLREERVDVAVMLAWNFEAEILAQQAEYRAAGGRFLVPVPHPRLV